MPDPRPRFTVIDGGTGERTHATLYNTGILDDDGNPVFRPGPGGGSEPPPPSGGHIVELATLATHMLWVKRGLGTLAAACAIGAGWAFANVYQPIQTLAKDSAVQTTILGQLKDDMKDIKSKLDADHNQPQARPRKR